MIWLILCQLLMSSVLFAGENYQPNMVDPIHEPWRYRHEYFLDGLGVYCIKESYDKSLWFGCSTGLYQYDGIDLKKIEMPREFSVSEEGPEKPHSVKNIYEINEQTLLCIVGDQLFLKREDKWTCLIQNIGSIFYKSELLKAKDGSYWLQGDREVWRVSSNLDATTKVIGYSKDHKVHSLYYDLNDNIWLVIKDNTNVSKLHKIPLDKWREKATWKLYPIPFENKENSSCITGYGKNKVLYGHYSGEKGFLVFDGNREIWEWHKKDLGEQNMSMTSFQIRNPEEAWGGTDYGIVRINRDREIRFYAREQLSMLNVPAYTPLYVYETSMERLWLYGEAGQVYSVDLSMEEWVTYEGLNYHCEWGKGQCVFTSDNEEVVIVDSTMKTWTKYSQRDGCIDNPNSCYVSSHGLLWVTGSHEQRAAFSIFDGLKWKRYSVKEFASNIQVHSLFEAHDKTIWMSSGGLYEPSNSKSGGALQYEVVNGREIRLKAHHHSKKLPYYIDSFAQTQDGVLWIGSKKIIGMGDGNRDKSLEYPNAKTNDMIVDRKNRLWAAKNNFGLYRYDDGHWSLAPDSKLFTGQRIADLLELSDGTIMVASNRGISRYDEKSWAENIYPEEFSMSSRHSQMDEDGSGSLWFSFSHHEPLSLEHAISGTKVVKTVRHRPEKTPPETMIKHYWDKVPQPGNFSVKWEAIDPWNDSALESLQFSWRLNDEEWTPFSSSQSTTFFTLKPGDYSFEVKSRDRVFNVDPTPAKILFSVEAPLWRQLWFQAVISLLMFSIGFIVWIVIHYRHKRLIDQANHLKEIDQVKTSFFLNLSHELRTPLTVIKGPIEDLLAFEKDPLKVNLLTIAKRNSDRIYDLVTQLLEFRKLEQGRVELDLREGDFIKELMEIYTLHQAMADMNDVKMEYDVQESCLGLVDTEKLKMILSNVLINGIKYSGHKGVVKVRAGEVEENVIEFSVEDNGIGVKREHLEHIFERFYRVSESTQIEGSGIGLNLAKELTELWGGSIHAESPIFNDVDRSGTRIRIRLPIKVSRERK